MLAYSKGYVAKIQSDAAAAKAWILENILVWPDLVPYYGLTEEEIAEATKKAEEKLN